MHKLKLLLFLSIFSISTALFADESFKNIYVFGDSLSDTGNLASVAPGFPDFPYYQGRITNGLVAVEIMAQRMGLPLKTSLHLIGPEQGNNYAVAAASAARNSAVDLNSQVAWFLANHGGLAPADTLYVMFIGGNDLRAARGKDTWAESMQVVEDAVSTIINQIQVLAASGAKNWFVVNAPDIGSIPETQLLASAYGLPELPVKTTTLSILFNGALKRRLQQLEESTDVEIKRFDLFKLFSRIVEKSDKLGFSNSTEPCFSSEQGMFLPGCSFGYNFDQYIFFDEIHPTARVHELIGIAMSRKYLDDDSKSHKDDEKDDGKEVESATH